MGSSNRTRVAYVAESNWGVTPATPTLTTVRRTGGSLKSPTETVTSNEIRSDRNRATVQRVGVSANGSMEFELSYGSHDDLLAAAFASAWTTAINFSDSVQITALTGTIAATGAFTNAFVGQWLKLSGFTTPGNNGYFRVATKTSANEITVEDPDDVLEDETKSAAITSGGCLRNGTTESSFTIEQSHLDLGFYLQFLGMRVGGVNLSIPASGLITGSFDFQGKEATAS
ncbi:MAG TPA: phage tail tube protein, partial [Thermoanaerobaculia bacterium]|nr:phage tail tube protein [Thermoanaerobaculia bacterium]